MDAAKTVSEFGISHLGSILDRSGYVLYSAADSLRACPVYLMGTNPGGSPEDQVDATVRSSLERLSAKSKNNYLDEAWTSASGRAWATGCAPLQRRVVWLLEQLGLDPRSVPAANLIFVRSVDLAGMPFEGMAELCWPLHEKVLEIVKPRVLLVFGNSDPSPYSFLREKFGSPDEEREESGHGNWKCRAFRAKNGLVVVGLPHLSRYNVIGKKNVINWIRRVSVL